MVLFRQAHRRVPHRTSTTVSCLCRRITQSRCLAVLSTTAKGRPSQGQRRLCLSTDRQQSRPKTHKMPGCTTRRACATTSSARRETMKNGGPRASRAHEVANPSMNDVTSLLHPLPDQCRQRRAGTDHSRQARLSTDPSTVVAFGHALPLAVTALRRVMSTASCVLWSAFTLGVFLVIRPNPMLHFAPFLSTHFFPCLNTTFKNGSFLSVVTFVQNVCVVSSP